MDNEQRIRTGICGDRRVEEMTDSMLEGIVRERQNARKLQRETEARVRNETIAEIMQRSPDVQQFVRFLVPDHDRTTCSDDNRGNVDRCLRCWLLLVMDGTHGFTEEDQLSLRHERIAHTGKEPSPR